MRLCKKLPQYFNLMDAIALCTAIGRSQALALGNFWIVNAALRLKSLPTRALDEISAKFIVPGKNVELPFSHMLTQLFCN